MADLLTNRERLAGVLDRAVADGESGAPARSAVERVFKVFELAGGNPELMETLACTNVAAVDLVLFGSFRDRVTLNGEQWSLTSAGGVGSNVRWRLYLPLSWRDRDGPVPVAVVVMWNPPEWHQVRPA